MQRALVLGAGFSKAVAGLPVTYEMLDAFKEVQEKEKKKGHSNRVIQGNRIFDFWRFLTETYLSRQLMKDDKLLESNIPTSFEAVLTFIDLNISSEINAQFEGSDGNYSLIKRNMFWQGTNMQQIRLDIESYLYLALIAPQINQELLKTFGAKFIDPDTTIITFNYDLIIDQYLFHNHAWFPRDGYGFEASVPATTVDEEVVSKNQLLKLHGSLNWEEERFFGPFQFKWRDDEGKAFFPGYVRDLNPPSFVYQGSHGGSRSWMLPSWIKQFETDEHLKVWHQAALALGKADEVIVVGYSLPEQDSAAVALFNGVDYSGKKIKLIDPNASKYKDKFRRIVKTNELHLIDMKLEDYL